MLVTENHTSTMRYSEATTHALIQFAQETPAFAPLLAGALRQAGITPQTTVAARLSHGEGDLDDPDVALLWPPHVPAAVARLHWLLHHLQQERSDTHWARQRLAEWLGTDEYAASYLACPALQPLLQDEVQPVWLAVFGLWGRWLRCPNLLGWPEDIDHITQNVVVCTTTLTERPAAVLRAVAQVSSGVVGAALAAAHYDFSHVPPELALWLLGNRDISLFRVTTQEDCTEIVHELDRLAVPYAVATEEGIVALAMLPAFRGSFLAIERDLEPLSYA